MKTYAINKTIEVFFVFLVLLLTCSKLSASNFLSDSDSYTNSVSTCSESIPAYTGSSVAACNDSAPDCSDSVSDCSDVATDCADFNSSDSDYTDSGSILTNSTLSCTDSTLNYTDSIPILTDSILASTDPVIDYSDSLLSGIDSSSDCADSAFGCTASASDFTDSVPDFADSAQDPAVSASSSPDFADSASNRVDLASDCTDSAASSHTAFAPSHTDSVPVLADSAPNDTDFISSENSEDEAFYVDSKILPKEAKLSLNDLFDSVLYKRITEETIAKARLGRIFKPVQQRFEHIKAEAELDNIKLVRKLAELKRKRALTINRNKFFKGNPEEPIADLYDIESAIADLEREQHICRCQIFVAISKKSDLLAEEKRITNIITNFMSALKEYP